MSSGTAAGQELMPPVDFDLHALVGIRLVDARAADVAAVQRQLGPLPRHLGRDPDITVRFVPRIDFDGPLRHVGLGQSGFDDHAFYMLRSRNNLPVRLHVPLDQVGGSLEIVAEHGLTAVPLLLAMINFTALAKGVLPLHASTVLHRGRGVLATGWSKGGKTETVLSLILRGATYVADEWSYVSADGGRVSGVPEPIRLWNWHLRQIPEHRDRLLSRPSRLRVSGLDAAGRALRAAARTSWGSSPTPAAGLLRRAEPLISRQAFVQLDPHALFEGALGPAVAPLDLVLLVVSHDSDAVVLEQADPAQVAARMRYSLQQERAPFMEVYQQFRYAFPDRSSPVVETADVREADLLTRALSEKPTWLLRHPYPVDLARLSGALEPLFARKPDGSSDVTTTGGGGS